MPESAPQFTAPQEEAIAWRRVDACVVAGPGSGKTTVLVERYRSLISGHGLKPNQILAITFTEKAAANMKQKIAEQFAHDPLMLRELEAGWVSTIHGFCARILRENAIAAGIDPRFQVLDARESDDLQIACLNQALDHLTSTRRAETLELIEALQSPWLVGDLKAAFDAIRSAGKSIAEVRTMPGPTTTLSQQAMADVLRGHLAAWPEKLTPLQRTHRGELLEWAGTIPAATDLLACAEANPLNLGRVPMDCRPPLRDFRENFSASAVDQKAAPFRSLIFDALEEFTALYQQRKIATGSLDFNDLERHTIQLLRDKPDVRKRIQEQFRQIMLDEFQDINEQQAELIDLVRGADVFFGVGDINQSIYGFRHASPGIFKKYRLSIEGGGKHFTQLLHNFRSREEILRSVEQLLNASDGIEARELIAGSAFGEKAIPSIEILRIRSAADEDGDEEAGTREARWIAWRILSLRSTLQLAGGGAADFRDFAVLCRNRDSMTAILREFEDRRIPYVCGRRQSFLVAREGLDLTALLQTIANPRDGVALATVLRSGLVGLSDESLLRLRVTGNSLAGGINKLRRDPAGLLAFAPDEGDKLRRFIRNLKRWRSDEGIVPLDLLLVRALGDCGLDAGEYESFLHLARTRGVRMPLNQFLAEIESLKNALSAESDLSDEDQGNCVQVMTAHAAKGLEFAVTIIAAMDKGTRTGSAPLTYTPLHGLGITWKESLPDSWQLRNQAHLKDREKQESNRLLYVAMTRAKEHLILSYSVGEKKPSNWAKLIESSELEALRFDEAGDPPVLNAVDGSGEAGEIVVVPRPAVEEQQDSAVNVTSLAVFGACPRKYYLQRYIGWSGFSVGLSGGAREKPYDPEDLPAAELGSFVHEVLAGKPGSHPLADVFLRSPLGLRANAATKSAREWDFIIDIDETLVRGTIDLWFEDEAGLHIVDYKTDAAVNADAYQPQLALYAMALERALGQPVATASLHFLRHDLVIQVSTDPAPVRVLVAALKAAQNSLDFPLNPGAQCKTCSYYKGLCPAT